jgi:hypothetical protein
MLPGLPWFDRSPQQYHITAARNHPCAPPPALTRVWSLPWRLERGRSFSILSRQWWAESVDTMPSLLRFLLVLCLLAGAGYGAMYALAHLYDPKPREITVSIPPDRFTKQH